MAHPAIMFSISVSTVSIVYAYIQQIKKDKKAENLEKWVRDKFPEIYNDLPWVHRKLLKSEVSLNIINNKKLIDDSDFEFMYKELKSFNKKLYISLAIGILGLIFTFITSHFLGWGI
jgi:hypothetical protein